jgi:hypothetical protein
VGTTGCEPAVSAVTERDVKYSQQLTRLLGTAKYLTIQSSRTDLGLAVGFKTNSSRPLYEDAAELGVCEHLS